MSAERVAPGINRKRNSYESIPEVPVIQVRRRTPSQEYLIPVRGFSVGADGFEPSASRTQTVRANQTALRPVCGYYTAICHINKA